MFVFSMQNVSPLESYFSGQKIEIQLSVFKNYRKILDFQDFIFCQIEEFCKTLPKCGRVEIESHIWCFGSILVNLYAK